MWFRYYDDTIDDKKINRVARESGVEYLMVFGAWSAILCLASRSPIRGKLMLSETLPMQLDDIAETLHDRSGNVDVTRILLHTFANAGMMHESDDTWCVSNWVDRQYESDVSTNRVRKYRENKKSERELPENGNVSNDNGNVSETLVERPQSTDYRLQSTENNNITDPILLELKAIKNYPFDVKIDSQKIREFQEDFPDVVAIEVVKQYATWVLDHPIEKKASPRSRLRNFFKNQQKWSDEHPRSAGSGMASVGNGTTNAYNQPADSEEVFREIMLHGCDEEVAI